MAEQNHQHLVGLVGDRWAAVFRPASLCWCCCMQAEHTPLAGAVPGPSWLPMLINHYPKGPAAGVTPA